MKQNWFKYDGSLLRKIEKEIVAGEKKQRTKSAKLIKEKIKEKALAMKVTGNLARGVYMINGKNKSFVGIKAPGFHNYLIEFGHFAGKKENGKDRKFVPAHPIVYPTFEEQADAVKKIMSESWTK